MDRAELRARYPVPRLPESWSTYQRRTFWGLSAIWLTGCIVLPNWLIENDSMAFFVGWWPIYLWLWFFPWRWSVSQGSRWSLRGASPEST